MKKELDRIDIKIAGADDFRFTANTFTALSGSTIAAQALTATTIAVSNDGTIGSTGDADAIAISSSGVVTFSQSPVFPDGSLAVVDLDIDGATDIGANLAAAALFIVDDGAGGTNRKTAVNSEYKEIDYSTEEFESKDPVTVILSKNGWIKTIKGHQDDYTNVKYKEGDAEKFIIKSKNNSM